MLTAVMVTAFAMFLGFCARRSLAWGSGVFRRYAIGRGCCPQDDGAKTSIGGDSEAILAGGYQLTLGYGGATFDGNPGTVESLS